MIDTVLSKFIAHVNCVVLEYRTESEILEQVSAGMRDCIATDDWLPDKYAQPDELVYRQYLLHLDPLSRFSIVSFVWGPGQRTPIHDHTTWGVMGVLRGAEISQSYKASHAGLVPADGEELLSAGSVAVLSPRIGDIHRVRNAYVDRVSISIHVYGADIGRLERHVFNEFTGARERFVSGYSGTANRAVKN